MSVSARDFHPVLSLRGPDVDFLDLNHYFGFSPKFMDYDSKYFDKFMDLWYL